MKANMTLTKGSKYSVEALTVTGWTTGDGTGHDGYNYSDYFRDGIYLGSDEHAIEPIFAPAMSVEQAEEFVRSHSDDDQLSEQDLEAAFAAIFERLADDDDREQGLWSHLCAAQA